MDWSRVRRQQGQVDRPRGVYTNLDELVRIQFRARDFSLQPQQPVNSILSGRYASRLRGRGLNFEELRRYLPGDDIRTMDWKVTARTRSPYVRVYSEEKDREVLVIVDQRINMFFGTRDKLKSVTAAELTALATWRAVDAGDRVGALIFNDEQLVDIKPQRSHKTVMTILGEVTRQNQALRADTEIAANAAMLNQALAKAVHMARHDALVIIISDFFGVDDETKQLTTRLAEHNDVLGVLVHDPIRIDMPGQHMSVSDGALQMQIDLNDEAVRHKLGSDYHNEQQQIRQFLHKLSAPLLMVSNAGDVVEQIRRLLGVPGRSS